MPATSGRGCGVRIGGFAACAFAASSCAATNGLVDVDAASVASAAALAEADVATASGCVPPPAAAVLPGMASAALAVGCGSDFAFGVTSPCAGMAVAENFGVRSMSPEVGGSGVPAAAGAPVGAAADE